MPGHYHGGAFIGQHNSWNGTELSGYKVVFVPFGEDGRPCGVAGLPDGSLLVPDDAAGTAWRVSARR